MKIDLITSGLAVSIALIATFGFKLTDCFVLSKINNVRRQVWVDFHKEILWQLFRVIKKPKYGRIVVDLKSAPI